MYALALHKDESGPAAVLAMLAGWLETPGLRAIVEDDGGTWPASGGLLERLEALHEFSQRWDFRGGAERLDIGGPRLALDEDRLLAGAAGIGLTVAADPRRSQYHHALVLGGTALASINRARRLGELVGGGLGVAHPAALTALRVIAANERDVLSQHPELADLAAGAATEFDVLAAAMARYLGGDPQIERHDDDNPHLSSARATVGRALVLAAPSSAPDRRANTSDNYRVYAERVHDGDSVLVVTSSIYLPYQFFTAILELGWQRAISIEAVGFPPDWMGGVLTGPKNVLQELRSAFFGALKLARAIVVSERS